MRRAALLIVVTAALLSVGGRAFAHPLGNFTTNTAAQLLVTPEGVEVVYVVDLAEIPALQVRQDLDGDEAGYEQRECDTLAGGVTVTADGAALPLRVAGTALSFPPGEAGLVTLRLECTLVADLADWPGGELDLTYADANLDGRLGWREVTAVGSGARLVSSDVPATSETDLLRSYPPQRLAAPLDVRRATLVAALGDGAAAPVPVAAARGGGMAERFTALVGTPELTLGVGALALLVALGLGGLHALAPGHGKTVMAAYLLSRDVRARQVTGLALTVAAAHTTGVLLLGALVGVTEIVAPERLYAWLGVASGLLFAGVGMTLLRQARRTGHGHHHHDHDHHDHDHDHDHPAPGWRGFVVPGLAGGLVPTPSALVVLLGGIALDRTWFGVLLVVCYGVGMGAVLVAAGWVLTRARGGLAARADSPRLARLTAALPTATATLLVLAGLGIAARAAVAL